MDSPQALRPERDSKGIALFMVIAAMSVLSILVTEFTYVAQVNQKIAYDGLDLVKAHYLAKTGLKLSLLRLKAYLQVKAAIKTMTGGGAGASGAAAVPKQLVDKIWSFPFIYPIPTAIPGLTMSDKDQIDKFQKASDLDGSFTATIEAESGKYNLNMILPSFAGSPPPAAPPSQPTTPPQGPPGTTPPAGTTPPPVNLNSDQARSALSNTMSSILNNKFQADPDFASEYRGFQFDDFMDGLFAWADRTYQRRTSSSKDLIQMKEAPFFNLTEMHMLPGIDDQLYDLFAPNFAVLGSTALDVNTITGSALQALVPEMTTDEVTEFFKYRDDPTTDNSFKSSDDFFNFLLNNVGYFHKDQTVLTQFKTNLANLGLQIGVDETSFKITVQAQVNQATRTIEAWVTLGSATSTTGSAPPPAAPPGSPPPLAGPGQNTPPDPGLRITYMRII